MLKSRLKTFIVVAVVALAFVLVSGSVILTIEKDKIVASPWLADLTESSAPTAVHLDSQEPMLNEPDCVPGLRSYGNARYGFSMCVPEDAEVLTQFDDKNVGVLDLVFVQKDDIDKLAKSALFPNDPYFAVLDTGVSAFILERLDVVGEIDEARLKSFLPPQIPCPYLSLGCGELEELEVKILEWKRSPTTDNLFFGYRDEVKGSKVKWNSIGFIGAISQSSYQLESIHPGNPVSPEALEIMTASIR